MYLIIFAVKLLLHELQVWKFLITFADVLELSSVTLDEFIQSLHDYVSVFFGEGNYLPWTVLVKGTRGVNIFVLFTCYIRHKNLYQHVCCKKLSQY